MTTTTSLPPITRPNGKLYQPRKIVAEEVGDEDECVIGVIVFGTHDIAVAQPLADEVARCWIGADAVAIKPSRVWWIDGFEMGRRMWKDDEARGRAGVFFADFAEAAVAAEPEPS